jgi:hypothetical protein
VEIVEHDKQRFGIAALAQDPGEAVQDSKALLIGIESLICVLSSRREQLRNETSEIFDWSDPGDERGSIRVSRVAA